jgi:hypothetical protein
MRNGSSNQFMVYDIVKVDGIQIFVSKECWRNIDVQFYTQLSSQTWKVVTSTSSSLWWPVLAVVCGDQY